MKSLSILYICIAVFISIQTIFLTFSNFIIIPQWDEYDVINRFISAIKNNNYLSFLFSQNNEHRTVVTNILFIIDYKFFNALGYIPRASIFFILLITTYELYKLFFKINNGQKEETTIKLNKKSNYAPKVFLLSLSVILLFSPDQSENFVRGFNNQVFFICCFNFLALINFYKFINSSSNFNKNKYFFFSIIFAVLSTFSMAPGFLIFFFLIIYSIFNNNFVKKNYLYTFLLIIAGAIAILFFFKDYNFYYSDRLSINSLSDFINFIYYQLVLLGNIGNHNNFTNIFLSLSSLVFFIYFIYLFFKEPKLKNSFTFFFILICLNVLLITLINSFGRLFLGVDHATASRYVTFINFYWIGIFVLFFIYLSYKNFRAFYLYLIGSIFLIFIIFSIYTEPTSSSQFKYHFNRYEVAKNSWLNEDYKNKNLNNLHPNPITRLKVLNFLREKNKNIFYKDVK